MSGHRPTVLVVGAGPTGITAATLLAQYGVETLVLDRWQDVYPQPRAVHLDDEVCRILDRLGVAAEFAGISRPAAGLRLIDPAMSVLAQFERPAHSRNGYPQANMFDQPELEKLLRANLSRYPHATLRGGAEVSGITDLADGGVRVMFTDRLTDQPHVLDADFLLGCDGANSVVRDHIGTTMEDLHFEQRWLVVDVACSVDLGQWDGVHQLCNPRRAGTFMQIGDVRYRWEFRLLPGEKAEDFGSLPALRPLIAPWIADTDDADLTIIRVAEYTFRAAIAETWRRGTTFLLGDAAHLTPPFIGQGMCAGLRDGMNLAWKLAGVIQGSLGPDVLDSYETERKDHARRMIGLALMVGRSMTAGGRFGDLMRRILVPRMDRIPGLRDRLLDSTTPPLPRSTMVHKNRVGRRLAGTLCPNAVTPGGGRLDALLGSGFAVITTRPLTGAEQSIVRPAGAVVHVAVPGSEAAEWLRRGRADAAIIRPDRTVMAAGPVGAVCQALPQRLRPEVTPSARPPSGR